MDSIKNQNLSEEIKTDKLQRRRAIQKAYYERNKEARKAYQIKYRQTVQDKLKLIEDTQSTIEK